MLTPKSPSTRITALLATTAALAACAAPNQPAPIPDAPITYEIESRSSEIQRTAQLLGAAAADTMTENGDWKTHVVADVAVTYERTLTNRKTGITTQVGLTVMSDSASAKRSLGIPLVTDINAINTVVLPADKDQPIFFANLRLDEAADGWTGNADCGNSHKGGRVSFDDANAVSFEEFRASLDQIKAVQAQILTNTVIAVEEPLVCQS